MSKMGASFLMLQLFLRPPLSKLKFIIVYIKYKLHKRNSTSIQENIFNPDREHQDPLTSSEQSLNVGIRKKKMLPPFVRVRIEKKRILNVKLRCERFERKF